MKDIIEQFYADIKKSRRECPWAKEQTMKQHFEELKSEIEEAKAAVEKNDEENLKEELGDIFWDTLFLMIIAEEKGYDVKDIIRNAQKKLRRRKPYVFGDNPRKVTIDEAKKIWREIKKKEKLER